MASTDARPFPLKNTAFRVVFPIFDADGDLVTGAAGLDSEVSKDQGTYADCTNEATEIATNSGTYYLDLTNTEMNADHVAVIVKTSTSGAKTTFLSLYPVETGDIPVNVTAYGGSAGTFSGGRPEVNTTHAAGTAWGSGAITAASIASDAITAAKIADGAIDAGALASDTITAAKIASSAITSAKFAADAITSTVIQDSAITAAKIASAALTNAKFGADAITASVLHSDVTTELQSGLATASSITTLTGYVDTEVAAILAAVDTEVAAIKAKTDNLPAAPAATGDIPSAATIAAAVGALTIEGSYDLIESLKLHNAALAGKVSVSAGTFTFRNLADSKDVIEAATDADGQRTSVTLDVS